MIIGLESSGMQPLGLIYGALTAVLTGKWNGCWKRTLSPRNAGSLISQLGFNVQ